MLTRETMKGLYILTITPFDEQGNLDEDAYRENVRKLVALGVDGIITSGTNGEFHTTTDEERVQIARIVVEETRRRGVAVIGASGVNTAESINRSRAARDVGAEAVMNVVPFYNTLSKSEVYQYFQDLSRACPDLGIIIYNRITGLHRRGKENGIRQDEGGKSTRCCEIILANARYLWCCISLRCLRPSRVRDAKKIGCCKDADRGCSSSGY